MAQRNWNRNVGHHLAKMFSIYCWLHKNVLKISSHTGINKDTLLISYHWGLNSSMISLDTIWHSGIGRKKTFILQKTF